MISLPLKALQDVPKKGKKQPTGGERGWGAFMGSSSEGLPLSWC